jgi:hypothetical protein
MLLYPETSYYNRKRNEGRSLPDGTEASFISFWDVNIRWILEYLIPEGKSIRDSSEDTEQESYGPIMGFC